MEWGGSTRGGILVWSGRFSEWWALSMEWVGSTRGGPLVWSGRFNERWDFSMEWEVQRKVGPEYVTLLRTPNV